MCMAPTATRTTRTTTKPSSSGFIDLLRRQETLFPAHVALWDGRNGFLYKDAGAADLLSTEPAGAVTSALACL